MQAWQLGSYEVVRRLGEGGMAQVYLARDVRLDREVAVKVLDKQLGERSGFRERFLREARVSAALDHPNIVPIFDFGDTENLLYLVMPYIGGGSLQEELQRTPMPPAEVVSYGTQMADALDYAHQRGVVHRDVKPANMLLHPDGRLMLTDFGLAKILDGAPRPATARNQPDAGTPEYMAPEQIEGRTDERSDIYGMGVVLYLLLTGHLPFTGATSAAVMEGHLYRLPEQPRRLNPAVTPALQTVIMQALAKDPQDRFARASELGAALLSALVAGDAEPLPFLLSSPLSNPSAAGSGQGMAPPALSPRAGASLPPALAPASFPAPNGGYATSEVGRSGSLRGARRTPGRAAPDRASWGSGHLAATRNEALAPGSSVAPRSLARPPAGTPSGFERPAMRMTAPPAPAAGQARMIAHAPAAPDDELEPRRMRMGTILLVALLVLAMILLSAVLVMHLMQIHSGAALQWTRSGRAVHLASWRMRE
ncbi:MAG TPA: protein kinase [Ktedonobacterales bacterium]|nr:protein kinase [Ktedonobacterales bacterium]